MMLILRKGGKMFLQFASLFGQHHQSIIGTKFLRPCRIVRAL